jgi:hypothetical protein
VSNRLPENRHCPNGPNDVECAPQLCLNANAKRRVRVITSAARWVRDYLVELESGEEARGPGPGEPRYNERELARVRALIAELEAELGI